MALHEMATNATKYGVLSAPGGRLEVVWCLDAAAGALRLDWRARGGPRLPAGPPPRRGFGTRVVAATIGGQLGGWVARDWRPEGLACTLEMPLPRVLAAPPAPVPLALAAQ
jgi:two-component sensor histidine kinase